MTDDEGMTFVPYDGFDDDEDGPYCYCGHTEGSHGSDPDGRPHCFGCDDADEDDDTDEYHRYERSE